MIFDHVQIAISNQTSCAQILLNSVHKSAESKRGSAVPNHKLNFRPRGQASEPMGAPFKGPTNQYIFLAGCLRSFSHFSPVPSKPSKAETLTDIYHNRTVTPKRNRKLLSSNRLSNLPRLRTCSREIMLTVHNISTIQSRHVSAGVDTALGIFTMQLSVTA